MLDTRQEFEFYRDHVHPQLSDNYQASGSAARIQSSAKQPLEHYEAHPHAEILNEPILLREFLWDVFYGLLSILATAALLGLFLLWWKQNTP